MPSSPVEDITFSQALNVSLNNYYDLLKKQVGGLTTEEYLQLKLVADTIDISYEEASAGGYKWWSYYNLLKRSDTAIDPTPISGQVLTAVKRLHEVYERFLNRLQDYVIVKNLTPEEQKQVADLDLIERKLRRDANALVLQDRRDWLEYAEFLGYDPGDDNAYLQWTSAYGSLDLIRQKLSEADRTILRKIQILDRQYPEPDDRAIVDGVVEFSDIAMRLRYPFYPDYEYDEGDQFSPEYLSRLPPGSTANFDDRRALGWDKTLKAMKSDKAGEFVADFDSSTQESESIKTDWNSSVSASYGFIKVRANASEKVSIQEDFNKATKITLSAKSAFRANINYPAWFKPSLFDNLRVKENIRDLDEFFGPKGSLRFYPISLILVRGFSVTFSSSQAWKYDYSRKFSASAGGGFKAFGINFGGNGGYSKHEEKHKVDKSGTTLTISDGDETLRFVGYAVKQNTIYDNLVKTAAGIQLKSV